MKSEFPEEKRIDCRTEAQRILAMSDGRLSEAMAVLERQFATLHNRAQVLFSFSGIVVTVTGFSGRLIAGTNNVAQFFIVCGLAVVIASAFYIYHRVMTLRWTTQQLGESDDDTLLNVIRRRDRKTTAYKLGGYILFAGIILYGIAIAIMLMNPSPLEVPVR